jgi:hypothetical protein
MWDKSSLEKQPRPRRSDTAVRKKEKKICFFCDEFIIFWMGDFRREEKQHNFVQLNVNSTLSNQIENVEVEINQNNFNYREQEISSDEIGHSLQY